MTYFNIKYKNVEHMEENAKPEGGAGSSLKLLLLAKLQITFRQLVNYPGHSIKNNTRDKKGT